MAKKQRKAIDAMGGRPKKNWIEIYQNLKPKKVQKTHTITEIWKLQYYYYNTYFVWKFFQKKTIHFNEVDNIICMRTNMFKKRLFVSITKQNDGYVCIYYIMIVI